MLVCKKRKRQEKQELSEAYSDVEYEAKTESVSISRPKTYHQSTSEGKLHYVNPVRVSTTLTSDIELKESDENTGHMYGANDKL